MPVRSSWEERSKGEATFSVRDRNWLLALNWYGRRFERKKEKQPFRKISLSRYLFQCAGLTFVSDTGKVIQYSQK
jgi:hypothetical protein